MKTTIKQRRQWAANALVWAAELPDSADRDTLLQIAREHLDFLEKSNKPGKVQAIDGEEGRAHPAQNLRVFPSGIW